MFFYGVGFDKLVKTTTSNKFKNDYSVERLKYSNDSIQLVSLVDSLIAKQIIFKPAERNKRYFNGKMYNDTIDRSWAIALPLKSNTFIYSTIDTLFYSPFDSSLIAGLLINKMRNEYISNTNNPEKIEYYGNGFVAWKGDGQYQIQILKNRTSSEKIESVSTKLFKIYCRNDDFEREGYNMNDIRFWKENDWIAKFNQ